MGRIVYKKARECILSKRKLEKRKWRNFSERKRRHRLTAAWYALGDKIPAYLKPSYKKLSQLQILTTAIQYIKDLSAFLQGN